MSEVRRAAVAVGSKAPDFQLINIATGDSISLREEYVGSVTLVNIWATWYAPCRLEMPSMQTVFEALGERGFRIAAISIDDSDRDKGWTVELALPWSGLQILAKGDGRALPPKDGDVWRMDFSRFNTYKDTSKDSGGWAWSPHGVWDSHVPECFTFVEFIESR